MTLSNEHFKNQSGSREGDLINIVRLLNEACFLGSALYLYTAMSVRPALVLDKSL
jgi:hypothetical protein